MEAFNESLQKNNTISVPVDGYEEEFLDLNSNYSIELDVGGNEIVNKLFSSARKTSSLTSNLAEIYI